MDELYPAKNRYMISFKSQHLLVGGGTTIQESRRFCLADNPEQVRTHFNKHFDDDYYWKKGFNDVLRDSIEVIHCPEAATWAFGFPRFTEDLRKKLN